MNPSNTGHGRQNPSVNSKKKPDSEDKEEEDKEEEEEEEEIATSLDSKEVSHVHIGTDAWDHSKQGLESEIPPETQNDPESEVTNGVNIGLVESPFQNTCLKHLQDCVVNGN
jgi:hypothetical protein